MPVPPISKVTHPYRTELTPVSFLRRSAYVFPDKLAVVHGERRYTYRQFEERANRLASGLRAAGLRHLDRVAFICPNTPAMLEAHFGVPAAGLVLVPINTRLNSDEVGYILNHSGAKFVFVDQELEALVKPLDLAGVRVIRVDDTGAPGDPYEDFLAAASPELVEPWIEDEMETISINYTSGTTGRPKGVMIHHRGAYLNAIGELLETGLSFDSTYLWTLPMFHCNGWCFTWGVTAMGATHVCLRRVESSRIWNLIDREGVTHYCGAPTVQIGIVNDPKAHRLTRTVTCATAADAAGEAEGARLPARARLWAHGNVRAAHGVRVECRVGSPARRGDGEEGRAPGAGLRRLRSRARRRRADAGRDDGRRDPRRGRDARQQCNEGLLRAAGRHCRSVSRR